MKSSNPLSISFHRHCCDFQMQPVPFYCDFQKQCRCCCFHQKLWNWCNQGGYTSFSDHSSWRNMNMGRQYQFISSRRSKIVGASTRSKAAFFAAATLEALLLLCGPRKAAAATAEGHFSSMNAAPLFCSFCGVCILFTRAVVFFTRNFCY